jgi:hypothetical protein
MRIELEGGNEALAAIVAEFLGHESKLPHASPFGDGVKIPSGQCKSILESVGTPVGITNLTLMGDKV